MCDSIFVLLPLFNRFFSSFFKPSHFSYGVHEKEPHEGKGVVSLSAIDQTFASTASTSRFGVVFRKKKKGSWDF